MKRITEVTGAFIAPSADVMGNVVLKENSSVWYQAVIRADHERIHIGKCSNIQDGCIIHVDEGWPVEIGEDVTIGHNAVIHGCQIGDGTLIGMGAVVLNGARIGKDCVIGANALVTQGMEIPDGMMALGSPAKVRRAVTKEEIARNRQNALLYVGFAREHFA